MTRSSPRRPIFRKCSRPSEECIDFLQKKGDGAVDRTDFNACVRVAQRGQTAALNDVTSGSAQPEVSGEESIKI